MRALMLALPLALAFPIALSTPALADVAGTDTGPAEEPEDEDEKEEDKGVCAVGVSPTSAASLALGGLLVLGLRRRP